jgi:hypothetical protein
MLPNETPVNVKPNLGADVLPYIEAAAAIERHDCFPGQFKEARVDQRDIDIRGLLIGTAQWSKWTPRLQRTQTESCRRTTYDVDTIGPKAELACDGGPPSLMGLVGVEYPGSSPINDLTLDKVSVGLGIERQSKLISCHLNASTLVYFASPDRRNIANGNMRES